MKINQIDKLTLHDAPQEIFSIFDEFIYITPDPRLIEERMKSFHIQYNKLIEDKTNDPIDIATWIIQEICDIHPLPDGNGRVARKLAFDLLSEKHQITFSQEEIVSYGDDPLYIQAFNRTRNNSAIKKWLEKVVQDKLDLERSSSSGPASSRI